MRDLLRLPVLLGTVAATALIGFLINQFGPVILEKVGDKEPVRVRADYDEDRYSDGWTMATSTPSLSSLGRRGGRPTSKYDAGLRRKAERS